MKDIKNFLYKLNEETDEFGKEEVSKNLAKEDALSLIADFVKSVKKDFSKYADRAEILNAANKTLAFYIDEIEEDEEEIVFNMDTPISNMGSEEPESEVGFREPESEVGFREPEEEY